MIKYSMTLDDRFAGVEFDEGMNSKELVLVQKMLNEAIEIRREDLKKIEAQTLTLEDSFENMFPPLSYRTVNCLLRAGHKTIGDVLGCKLSEISNIRNLGRKSYEEIEERFKKYGSFKEEDQ